MNIKNEITIPKNTCVGCRSRDEMNRCLAEEIDSQRKQLAVQLERLEKLERQLDQKVSSLARLKQFKSAAVN